MRITEKMVIHGMMDDIQSHLVQIAHMQEQVSTGKRIHRVSDDPNAASKTIDIKFTISGLEQYKKNADEASAWMSNTLTNLGQVRGIINEAKVLALQGGTDTLTPEARQTSARVIERLAARLYDVANSKWEGQTVFGGHKTSTAAFTQTGVYQGDDGVMRRSIGPGEFVQVNYGGEQVFKDGVDIFQALNDLKTAFENNDIPAISATLDDWDEALGNVLKLEAVMGSDSERVEAAKTRLEEGQFTLKELLSKNEDVDLAQAIVQLQSLQNVYQAALSVGSQLLQQSLLRFLK
ncbi:MAG: flagellar hook-associated protein FlgL [Elusimicrobiota bacterium]